MDVDALASRAVAAYQGGGRDRLARLVERKLGRSRAGARALQALREDREADLARDLLADELARDRRRFMALIAVGVVLAGWGVYGLARQQFFAPPGSSVPSGSSAPPVPVVADRGSLVLNYGSSGDVDGSLIYKYGYADNVPDLTMASDSFIATGGARIARLPPGTTAGSGSCGQAADASSAARIDGLKIGDVVCMRTSAVAVAAVTVSNIAGEGTNEIYQLDIAYWSSP